MSKTMATSDSRKPATRVTPHAPLYEGCISSMFLSGKPVKRVLRSKPIATNKHSPPYLLLLKESGMNRNLVLRFQRVNVRNYSEFRNCPENFVTITDLCLVHSLTGISIDRQIQVLLFGLSEKDLTRKGSRLVGSIKDVT